MPRSNCPDCGKSVFYRRAGREAPLDCPRCGTSFHIGALGTGWGEAFVLAILWAGAMLPVGILLVNHVTALGRWGWILPLLCPFVAIAAAGLTHRSARVSLLLAAMLLPTSVCCLGFLTLLRYGASLHRG
jgi:uncharacterized protein (DUF983 family)